MLLQFPVVDLPVAAYCAHTPPVAETPAARLTVSPPDQDESVYLIELRYRQYLAQHALQELFESGELNGPAA
jgi:hypothetical protein